MSQITEIQFKNRFTALILAGREFPKKQLDRHILLISAILGLDPSHSYTEAELNELLLQWSNRFGDNFGLDHVTLRRYLVDEGYLGRDSAGYSYALKKSGLAFTYDQAIAALNLDRIVAEARAERERKKQQYLRNAGN